MLKILIALYVIATSSALIFLKLGSKDAAPLQMDSGRLLFNINIFVLLGGLLYALSFILYTYLISKYELGYIIPLVTALVYIVIFTASYFIFNEVFTLFKIMGIGLILAGIILLNVKR